MLDLYENIFKVLIISVLCLLFKSCKSTEILRKDRKEKDSTDDVRDDQMEDYEEEMEQQNNQVIVN
jgi:hypothetical protein